MKITGPFRKGKSEDELSQMEPATWAAVAEYIEEGVRDFEKEKGLSPVYIRHWRGTPLVDADILLVYETLYPGAAGPDNGSGGKSPEPDPPKGNSTAVRITPNGKIISMSPTNGSPDMLSDFVPDVCNGEEESSDSPWPDEPGGVVRCCVCLEFIAEDLASVSTAGRESSLGTEFSGGV